MFFQKRQALPAQLTSYDLLKAVSVLFMFVDHIGAYVMPEYTWFRVFGRLGFPAFFFLAGYVYDRPVKNDIMIGAGILVATNAIYGSYILPLNALVTFTLTKLFVRGMGRNIFSGWEPLLYAIWALVLLAWPTGQLFEYGTYGFFLGLAGYAVRHRDQLGIGPNARLMFLGLVAILMPLGQMIDFMFNPAQAIVCSVLMIGLFVFLYRFQPCELTGLTTKIPVLIRKPIQILGRYSLEIYVVHLILIKGYSFYLHYGESHWLSPRLFH